MGADLKIVYREHQIVLGGFTSLVGLLQLLPSSLLTADAGGIIRLFANEGYEEIWKVEAHRNAVTSVQYRASKIASGGSDGNISVWDSRNGELLQELISSVAVWKVRWVENSLVALFTEDVNNVRKAIMKVSITVWGRGTRGISE